MMSTKTTKQNAYRFFCWRALVAIAVILSGRCEVRAQERPSLSVDWGDANQTRYRQDICQRYSVWANSEVELRHAIQGMTLYPVLLIDQYFQLDEVGAISTDNPGILAMLLDELARRAGFTWRDTYAVTEGPDEGMTWDDILIKGVDYFDMFPTWWVTSVDRLNQGVTFPLGWLDSSIILVGLKAEESVAVNLWNWVEPFHKDVWILLLATIVWSALVHLIIEATSRGREGRSLSLWFIDSLYQSYNMFDTEGDDDRPDTAASKVLSFSFSVWVFLLGSTYTANLASFFVEERQNERAINSIDEAVAAGVALCNWADTFQDEYISKHYPTANVIMYETEELLYKGLMDGHCGFAVSTVTTLRLFERDSSINIDCSLEQVGNVLVFSEAAFASQGDVGKLCTTLIRDVVNLHMTEMASDGTLQRLWDTHFSKNTDLNCLFETGEGDGDPDDQLSELSLSIYEMAGTFCLHLAMTVLALFLAFVRLYRVRHGKTPVLDPAICSEKNCESGAEADGCHPDTKMTLTTTSEKSGTSHRDTPAAAESAAENITEIATLSEQVAGLELRTDEMKMELVQMKTMLSSIRDDMSCVVTALQIASA